MISLGAKEVLERALALMPEKAKIKDARFEGASIVAFSESEEFLKEAPKVGAEIAKAMKLRVSIRAARNLLEEPEKTKKFIERIGKKAEITGIFFDIYASKVIIEAKKPEILKQASELIRIKTKWTPVIFRKPPLKSSIIDTIRRMITENSKERAEFLHEVGLRIYEEGKEPRWVRASFLGGFREVGRSSVLLQTPESRVLLDAGVNVASKEDMYPYFDAPEFDLSRLDAIIVTHAHLDHCGALPLLYRYGYRGPTYVTPPTLPLMVLLLLDFMEVAEREGSSAPFSSKDIKELVLHTITIPLHEVTNITPDMRLTFYNAGHILGSAIAHIHVGEGLHNVVYTGDLKFAKTRLLDPAENVFPRAETVIIESTYGGEQDIAVPREEAEQKLIEIVKKVTEAGGKVLIPALGVGRSQEVMLILQEAVRENKIPELKIYVDGIVWDATAIHTTYPEYLSKEIMNKVYSEEGNPLLDPIFLRVGSQKEREKVIEEEEPSVILATSGMLTGGPSVFYFSKLALWEKNAIIFVNYQAEGTLGRKVQKGFKEVVLYNNGGKEVIPVNLQVYTIEGLSAHSSRDELEKFVLTMQPRPRQIIVGHGESGKCVNLSRFFRRNRFDSKAPRNLDAVRLR